jgi:uncharacterized membrane protein (UPF0127 family)
VNFPLVKKLFAVAVLVALAIVIVISACSATQPGAPTGKATQTTLTAIQYPSPSFISSQDCEGVQHGKLPITDLTISAGNAPDITVQVEVADEASERAQGLMCRESIPRGTGMLFIYDTDRSNGFWMFNTYAAIDILYLDQSGDVVDNITMTPCTRDAANDSGANSSTDGEWRARCTAEARKYIPSGPWRNTLELPAGWLEAQGTGGTLSGEITVSWTTPLP